MEDLIVIEKTQENIVTLIDNSRQNIDLSLILKLNENNEFEKALLEDIEIGDYLTPYPNYYVWNPPKVEELTRYSDLQGVNPASLWFEKCFPMMRKIQPGDRNSSRAIGLKLIEHAFSYQNDSILLKIREHVSPNCQS